MFLCDSFFNINLKDNFFDCAIGLHTIYHMDKDRQEEAVKKLITVTKPGHPIIIVYRNPDTLLSYFITPLRLIKSVFKQLKKGSTKSTSEDNLYAFAHSLDWWNRFDELAEIEILPWRSFFSPHQKILIPDNKLGKKMFNILFELEEKFPHFFVKHFQYPMIVLKKKETA